jgi:UDP-N-acetylmuramoyl-L-alanyl-D-glutamate--2,6-diaminopimelate ligase
MKETSFEVIYRGESATIVSSLVGRFNVSNLLAAFATGLALNIPKDVIVKGIQNIKSVRGRFEQISSPKGWSAVVDYAHTPDGLEKTLRAIHDVFDSNKKGKIVTVFGCGGNRDRTKRPKMAAIATELSDITFVTSDNPRYENADAIIEEVMTGVKSSATVYKETDRKLAIINALKLAQSGDIVLIAGKGHEDYQIIGDRKIHFSDREIVEEYISATA